MDSTSERLAEAEIVRDTANELDQLFRQRHSMKEVESILRQMLNRERQPVAAEPVEGLNEQIRLLRETNKAAQVKRIEAEQRVKALEKQMECARNDLYSAIAQMASTDDQLICFLVKSAFTSLGGKI